MEVEKEIKTIKVYYQCPKCNNGHLVLCSASPISNPPEYKHKCNNKDCNYTQIFIRTISIYKTNRNLK